MSTFRVDWIMEDVKNGVGWSERWYVTAPDNDTAADLVSGYWTKRRAITCDNVFLRFERVCNADPPRDSQFEAIPATPLNHGTIDSTTSPPMGYDMALLVRRDSATGTIFGHTFLHGLPTSIITTNREFDLSLGPVGFSAAFAALATEVTGGGYQIRKKTAAGPPPVYTPLTCATYIPLRITTHRVGRPFDQLRGKRRIA